MDQDIQKIIEEQKRKMPKAVRDAIVNIDMNHELQRLSESHGLRADQGSALEAEIFLLLLGLEHPNVFVKNLTRTGMFSGDQATKLANDIDKTILAPIKHELLKMFQEQPHDEQKEKTEEPKPPQNLPTQQQNFAQQKLEQSTRKPPETIKTNAKYHGNDPYREEIT